VNVNVEVERVGDCDGVWECDGLSLASCEVVRVGLAVELGSGVVVTDGFGV
jgi:hypothetical protein